ncbi:DUF4823 domain-containing protein [uncultured Sneathiella sp.]|uniref:DUF4823 domain-containing protein n=1 Tax=uncultured Sneathiella sp. TaxID=879315 RepID=UPI0030EB4465|tara:strand:- start:4417 stop:4737 length:321 start_codon:yes stop_codon:yes gene_type:complete
MAAEPSINQFDFVIDENVGALKIAKERASSATANYLFAPKILYLEGRATEWSLVSDKITINYVIYDAHSGEKTASKTVNAKIGFATFGEDHPLGLVLKTVKNFLMK